LVAFFFAAVFLVELLFAALLFDRARLLVAVLRAAAALAVRVFLRVVFKSPSMKVPTFFFVILGRDIDSMHEDDHHAQPFQIDPLMRFPQP
jgi:hypothetical protein